MRSTKQRGVIARSAPQNAEPVAPFGAEASRNSCVATARNPIRSKAASGLVAAVALLLLLTGCNTASNMAHEVGGWFRTDSGGKQVGGRSTRSTGETSSTAPSELPGGGQQNAGEEVPPAVPAGEVTREPLTTTSNNPPPRQPGGAVKVGLLLPLSGKHAALGKSFQNAAQLAVNDLSADNFELMPKDIGETSADVSRAVGDALSDGAQLIIGPVFSEHVANVKSQVAGKVPVLSLSNDVNVAGNGTYVLGFSPAQQVQRALQYETGKGVTRLAVLAPSSIYGDIALSAAQASGITIVETQRYTSDKLSIKKAVAAISAKRSDIQGLLIADGGANLTTIANELTAVALSARDIAIIGTGLWDEQNAGQYNVLVGGVYASPDPSSRARFVTRYQSVYGGKPVRLATLAYDATALAAVLAKQGKPFGDEILTDPSGFAGVDGIFRLTNSGVAERGLAILEVTAGGTKVVDPSPSKF